MTPNNPMTEGEALALTARPQDVALLPCPFCGLDVTDDEGCFPLNRERTKWEVRCGNPSCFAHDACDESRLAAIARWNRRSDAALASAQAREDELRAEVEMLRSQVRTAANFADTAQELHQHEKARAERLEEALRWYADQAAACRKFGRDGDIGRQALDADGGKRARAALSTNAATQTGATT